MHSVVSMIFFSFIITFSLIIKYKLVLITSLYKTEDRVELHSNLVKLNIEKFCGSEYQYKVVHI